MTQSRNLIQHCRVSFAWLTLVLVGILVFQPAAAMAAQKYDTPAVLNASRILPPQLLSGPNHRVQEQVRNDGFINIYTVDSNIQSIPNLASLQLYPPRCCASGSMRSTLWPSWRKSKGQKNIRSPLKRPGRTR